MSGPIDPPDIREIPHADRDLAITYFTPERFAAKPQVGLGIRQGLRSFLSWLTWPSFADDKRAEGAWCPCELKGGIVKDGSGPVGLLVADVDECAAGGFNRSVELCSSAAGCVVHTFSATPEQAKHRIVLLLDRPLTADEFPIAWRKFARRLEAQGVVIDKGCKNVNRLYFACVARSPEAWLGARILEGTPLPVDSMLAIGRAEEAEAERAREAARAHAAAAPREGPRRARYIEAAVSRERSNIANASPGGRHPALCRAAYALARFDLPAHELEAALLGPFVAVAGESRRREGLRAIHDAVTARRSEAV